MDDHGLVWLSVGDIPIEIAGAMCGSKFEPCIATLGMVASALGFYLSERPDRVEPLIRELLGMGE